MKEPSMLFFRVAAAGISAGALSGAMLFGVTGPASADPTPAPAPPNCTAADLAAVSAGVSAATSVYLFAHPDVNDYMTGLKGQTREDADEHLHQYMDANPQTRTDLDAIRQPWTDFKSRCLR